MNKRTISSIPDENKIEELLEKIQPLPSRDFYKKMEQAHWWTEQVQPRAGANNSRLKLAVAGVVLLAITMFAVTPQGHAIAQEALQFFTRMQVHITPIQSYPTDPSTSIELSADIEKASIQIGLDIKRLTSLPVGYSLWSVDYFPQNNKKVCSLYGYGPRPEEIKGPITGWLTLCQESQKPYDEVSQEANIEPIQIGKYSGEYYVGGWTSTGWETYPIPIRQKVRWFQDGYYFTLEYIADTRELSLTPILTKDEFIAIAESLK